MKASVDEITDLIRQSNVRGLAKAISLLEYDSSAREALVERFYSNDSINSNNCLGITGPPGVGKSTLINSLIENYRALGKTVGVLAVDPSSPISGGAVLGDRVRMHQHNTDPGVFIRSLASRNMLGGLSRATKHALHLYRAFGFDVIIIETVGVGQNEVDIVSYADVVALVLAPGMGDAIQTIKSGIMEIADVFVINKADKIGASQLESMIYQIFHARDSNIIPPILQSIADKKEGILPIIETADRLFSNGDNRSNQKKIKRISDEILSLVLHRIIEEINSSLNSFASQVAEGSMTPVQASDKILAHVADSISKLNE